MRLFHCYGSYVPRTFELGIGVYNYEELEIALLLGPFTLAIVFNRKKQISNDHIADSFRYMHCGSYDLGKDAQ